MFDRRLTKEQVEILWSIGTKRELERIYKALGNIHPMELPDDWRGELVFKGKSA